MNVVERTIRKFNRWNGKQVNKETVEALLKKVSAMKEPLLSELKNKLIKAVDIIEANVGELEIPTLKFKPIQIPVIKKTAQASDTESIHVFRVEDCHGLEHVENDKHLGGKPLDGLSDTTYKVITDRIVELIKGGGLVWRRPWNENVNYATDLAHNFVTKRAYRAGNYYLNWLLIGMHIRIKGQRKLIKYNSPWYFTFKQVTDLGGKVKAGENAWPVVYFKWLYKDIKANKLIPKEQALIKGKLKPGIEKFPGLFYYNVFNFDQCEGLKISAKKAKPKSNAERIASAEKIISSMPNAPTINYQGQDAWYRRDIDTVQVPRIEHFPKEQDFYSVQFHELIHSTGHPDRVYREREATRRFGDKNYAFEELIAELGASFLCGESGIFYYTMKNSAAYIKGWSSKLKKEMTADPKFFLRAASQAQRAADYILDRRAEEERESVRAVAGTLQPKPKKIPVPKPEKKLKPAIIKQAPMPKVSSLKGFGTADTAGKKVETFRLPGVFSELLGDLQPYKLVIIIPGETHSSKSELAKQLADAFLSIGKRTAYVDWEQGGMTSRDTRESIARWVSQANQSRLCVTPDADGEELPRTLEAIESLGDHFDVVFVDSASMIKVRLNDWVEDLRRKRPDTIWVLLFQQTTDGGTRGGSGAEFDAPTILKTYRPDESTYKKNYAKVVKNRGNKTGLFYNIAGRYIMKTA